MENYLMLDGKKYELSPDLIDALRGGTLEEDESPFSRESGDIYFEMNGMGEVIECVDYGTIWDNSSFAVANYCRDRSLVEQRSLHETLDRLLWRYSAEHGLASGWDHSRFNYRIYRRMDNGEFALDYNDTYKSQGAVYFRNRETAEAAIEEVVKPFLADHPDFVW